MKYIAITFAVCIIPALAVSAIIISTQNMTYEQVVTECAMKGYYERKGVKIYCELNNPLEN